MERLTKIMDGISYSSRHGVVIAKCENCIQRRDSCFEEDCAATLEVVSRLAAYEDAEEQGRIAVLPCKVGDNIFWVGRHNKKLQIVVYSVEGIMLFKDHWGISCGTTLRFSKSDMGRTWFLTFEEAERAMEDMQDE